MSYIRKVMICKKTFGMLFAVLSLFGIHAGTCAQTKGVLLQEKRGNIP